MRCIDLTHLISWKCRSTPGTEPPRLQPANTYDRDGFQETLLTMYSPYRDPHGSTGPSVCGADHAGPVSSGAVHRPGAGDPLSGAEGGERIPFSAVERVRPLADRAEFLLFHTGWGRYWGTERYFGDYPCIDSDIVDYLLQSGKKGVDWTPSGWILLRTPF